MATPYEQQRIKSLERLLAEANELRDALLSSQTSSTNDREKLRIKQDLRQTEEQIANLEGELATLKRKIAPPATPTTEPLKVFLCHAKEDAAEVRKVYNRLKNSGYNIKPWFDEEDIPAGMTWDFFIQRALRQEIDLILAFLSNASVKKEGYVNKELTISLDIAQEKPEGTIFLIPVLLEDCPLPFRLQHLNAVRYYNDPNRAYDRIIESMKLRATQRNLKLE